MIKFLPKEFFLGILYLLLVRDLLSAQPIQLIPKKDTQVLETLPSFSIEEEEDFWEGTPPSVIETYFPKIPLHLTSPTFRALRTEVLKEKYSSLSQNALYEKTRVSLLTNIGEFDKARDILLETTLPHKEVLLLNLQWLEGNPKKACEKIANLIRTSPTLEWKKQNVYCLYSEGEEERAKVALELLNESNVEDASLLKALFDPSFLPSFDSSLANSPFLLTVWAETGQEIPEEDLQSLPPSSLRLVAMLKKIPFTTRLNAAEKAFSEGSLTQEDLSTFVKDVPPETLLGKIGEALKSPKFEDLLPLLENASQEQKLGFVVEVFKDDFLGINPSPSTLELAPYLVRAFVEINQRDTAQKWGTFYMREAPEDAISVLPLLYLAFPDINWGSSQFKAWQAYQKRTHPTQAGQRSYALRRILEALGDFAGSALLEEPAPPSWRQEKSLFEGDSLDLLRAAVKSQRKGETLLFILIMGEETPFKTLSPDKYGPLLEALTKVGYGEKARALALDILLAINL